MAVPEAKVHTILNLVKEPISLDIPLGEDGESCLADVIRDEHAADPEALVIDATFKHAMQRLLTTLTPREEKIICMRFGIRQKTSHTLEETGKVFGITRERIRQIRSDRAQETAALRSSLAPSHADNKIDALNRYRLEARLILLESGEIILDLRGAQEQ